MARRAKPFLPPADEFDATVVLWGKGQELYRVHDAIYKGNGFNPSRKGNAQNSRIRPHSHSWIALFDLYELSIYRFRHKSRLRSEEPTGSPSQSTVDQRTGTALRCAASAQCGSCL
jgi:hypothetical protein